MSYKYDVGEIVHVRSIISAEAKVVDRLCKQGISLYQVQILDGAHESKLLWFAENEVYEN